MTEPLFATTPVEHSPGACLPLALGAPFVAFGLFSLLMAGFSAHGVERVWFAASGAVAVAVPFVVRRFLRPGADPTTLSLAHDGTVTLHVRRGDVVMPPARLARVVTGAVTTSVQGSRSSRRVVVFVDGAGEQIAQVGRASFADADLGAFFEALRTVRPDVTFEHR
ncbi:hypothetical protein [Kineosporia sp. A_224]|uniref:hypothetical protein n=1 Tax=Kineosporia sp. A_224 TaxID=1962180 RepID=UPI000B4C0603|nr:hypothetical protein [Kineosporia sp. A_224]